MEQQGLASGTGTSIQPTPLGLGRKELHQRLTGPVLHLEPPVVVGWQGVQSQTQGKGSGYVRRRCFGINAFGFGPRALCYLFQQGRPPRCVDPKPCFAGAALGPKERLLIQTGTHPFRPRKPRMSQTLGGIQGLICQTKVGFQGDNPGVIVSVTVHQTLGEAALPGFVPEVTLGPQGLVNPVRPFFAIPGAHLRVFACGFPQKGGQINPRLQVLSVP